MGKRRSGKRNFGAGETKRVKVTNEEAEELPGLQEDKGSVGLDVYIQQKDRVERKVDVIVKDIENNCSRSLTIRGAGLGVEKTIAVVEELKRNFMKQGTRYSQETSIKVDDNNESHLQVILIIDRN